MNTEKLEKTIDELRHAIDGLRRDVEKLNAEKEEPDNALEEWKIARAIIDKFDGILTDVRKYSFSVITGLITAQGILGFSAQTPDIIEIIAVICTMPVVPALYWLDRYFFGLLWGAVMRASCLEKFRLKTINLTLSVSGFASSQTITKSGYIPIVYLMFLISLVILGAFVIRDQKIAIDDVTTIMFIVASVLAGIGLLVIHSLTNIENSSVTKTVNKLFKIYGKEVTTGIGAHHKISDNELDNFINKLLESGGKYDGKLKEVVDEMNKSPVDRNAVDKSIRAILEEKP